MPVLDVKMHPLIPCHPARARILLKEKKASAYWNKLGIFCIILHIEVEPGNQKVVLGFDPGSKFHGVSILSQGRTVLNVMVEAVTWVKDLVEVRRNMRRARRHRNLRRRPARFKNRLQNRQSLPPSTQARWGQILRIITQLAKILPISDVVIEDVSARSKKGQKRWNQSFAPLLAGKNWLYQELKKKFRLTLKHGYETKALRDYFGLKKTSNKAKKTFNSHAVDSWVLAASLSGAKKPTESGLFYCVPIRLHRRQLHMFQFAKGGLRKLYGSTRSLSLSRGTLVVHPKYSFCYVGGSSNGRISLHSIATGQRLTQQAKFSDLKIKTRLSFRSKWIEAQFKEAKNSSFPLKGEGLLFCTKR